MGRCGRAARVSDSAFVQGGAGLAHGRARHQMVGVESSTAENAILEEKDPELAKMRNELMARYGNDAAEAKSASDVAMSIVEREDKWTPVEAAELVGTEGKAIRPILISIFQILDEDGNGKIDEAEGVAAGRALFGAALNGNQAQNWWDELLVYSDDDNDLCVSLEEWIGFQTHNFSDVPVKVAMERLQQMKDKLQEGAAARATQLSRRAAFSSSTAAAAEEVKVTPPLVTPRRMVTANLRGGF